MLLTWDSLRVYVADMMNLDNIERLSFYVDPNELTVEGMAIAPDGEIIGRSKKPIDGEQMGTLKGFARKFYSIRQPDSVRAAVVEIDYKKRHADVGIYYEKNGRKLKHEEPHDF